MGERETVTLSYQRAQRYGPARWSRGLGRGWSALAAVVWMGFVGPGLCVKLIPDIAWPEWLIKGVWVMWLGNGLVFLAGWCVAVIFAQLMDETDLAMMFLTSGLCGLTAIAAAATVGL